MAGEVVRILRAGNHYEVLDLTKDTSFDEVKRAYRALSLKVHPDSNKRADAGAAQVRVGEAFRVLSDEQERAACNRAVDAQRSGEERRAPSKADGRREKPRAKTAAEVAEEEAELERNRQWLDDLELREWVAKARYEQTFLILTCAGLLGFAAIGTVIAVVYFAVPSSNGASETGWLWSNVLWLSQFAANLLMVVAGIYAIPFRVCLFFMV